MKLLRGIVVVTFFFVGLGHADHKSTSDEGRRENLPKWQTGKTFNTLVPSPRNCLCDCRREGAYRYHRSRGEYFQIDPPQRVILCPTRLIRVLATSTVPDGRRRQWENLVKQNCSQRSVAIPATASDCSGIEERRQVCAGFTWEIERESNYFEHINFPDGVLENCSLER